MKHLGDITKLKGSEVPLVDIVTGGSPCQDLSVAGKREGLAGERSGLFMEQIRLIKEMRESDRANGRTNEHIRPRYMVWENVPGAFSSNKGEDFRCVLEETAKVADNNAIIPRLATGKDGKQKWSKSGCIMGDGWSIAWRLHDAQFWGVPQRRKRISLVADFGGETAPEILFERKGVSGDITESGKEGERVAGSAERSVSATITASYGSNWNGNVGAYNGENFVIEQKAISFQERAGKPGGGKGILIQNERIGALSTLNNQSVCAFEPGAASRLGGYCWEDKAGTLRANAGDNQQAVCYGISSYDSNSMKSANPHSGIYEAETARTLDLNGGSPACNQGGMAIVQSAGVDTYNQTIDEELAQPLRAADGGDSTPKVVCIENHPTDGRVKISEDGKVQTLLSRMGTGGGNVPMVMERQEPIVLESNQNHATIQTDGVSTALPASMGMGGGYVPMVMEQPQTFADVAACRSAVDGRSGVHSQMMNDPEGNFVLEPVTASKASHFTRGIEGNVADTLLATDYKEPQLVAMSFGNGQVHDAMSPSVEVSKTLNCMDDPAKVVTYGLDRAAYNQGKNAKFGFSVDEEKVGPQTAMGPGAVCSYQNVTGTLCSRISAGTSNQLANDDMFVANTSVVRRLTPLECERLQGFPDGWTDIGDWIDSKGKKHKGDADAPRYKALGNSIALPFWQWMAERMVKHLNKEKPTMGSLFDGIGGFPLAYSRAGCEPIWASEIEEFPIAVTKIRFKEEVET